MMREAAAVSPDAAAAVDDRVAIDLLFAAPPFTGLDHHALHILRGLAEVGWPVDVWVSRQVAPAIALDARSHRLVPFPTPPRPLRLGWEQWMVPWRFGRHPRGYGLLHAVTGVAPILCDIPLVVTVPDLTFRLSPQDLHPRARLYFGTLVPASIRRARRVMVSSEAVRRQVIDLFGVDADRVTAIPLCAEAFFVAPPADVVVQTRKRYRLPERYVLSVGTIDSRKDLSRLRAAYDLLPPDCADVALVFAGRTAYGAERLAQRLGRQPKRGHVIMLGYVPREDLPALYAGASAFVYPSRYEGFGLPVLEAMACGAPVIVSSAGALAELVGNAGVVLQTADPAELTQAIERLLRFAPDRDALRQRGLARARQYTPRRLGEATVRVYQEALRG
ncbi:MAG: glycosyltransferase family 4 protein [Chloroflexi bacterium]|nr:MAG: glycosyltransferase family 4 protein [Chloroflexota bacterium]